MNRTITLLCVALILAAGIAIAGPLPTNCNTAANNSLIINSAIVSDVNYELAINVATNNPAPATMTATGLYAIENDYSTATVTKATFNNVPEVTARNAPALTVAGNVTWKRTLSVQLIT